MFVGWIGLALGTSCPRSAWAANAGNEAAPTSAEQPVGAAEPDFLFGRPRGLIGATGGWLRASQSGGIFDFTRELLTVDDRAFDSTTGSFVLGRALRSRIDLLLEIGFSQATTVSEYRDFVDADDLSITQTTELSQAPLVGSLRFWLIPRGREVGRFTWVAHRVTPYVGLGGGTRWYRFGQFGDFVDVVDLSIFTDRLESSGWAGTVHVFAGTSFRLSKQLFAVIEARQAWSDTQLADDFIGFDNIDLDGLHVTGGVEFVF
ncbi:MAG: hypothetical protein VYE68_01955 [Acidobacteriota bacterium]|nr:hypothetical protein [Acidobacteriota bacterium]